MKDEQLVERLAQKVNLSASRLRVLFKAEMGVTPSQYIKKLRMEKAKGLAETTHLTMTRIIAEVWGGEESHFRREFKKAWGQTLTECRKSFDEQAEEENGSKNTS